MFSVLAVAKAATLAGREICWPEWALAIYLWQDAAVALLFGGFDLLTGKPRLNWILYGAAVAYVALNVPLARVLSSPMTLAMFGATGGALADSIRHYLTWQSVASLMLVIAAGVTFPVLYRRLSSRALAITGAAGIGVAIIGGIAAAAEETHGLHRNAFFTFLSSTLPRIRAERAEKDWRRSPFPSEASAGLAHFRGAAAGRNVVIIVLESTSAAHLKPYGAAADPMPNLTHLASRAIVFEHAYAVYPESIKGLLPVLCSRYPAFDSSAEAHARTATPSIAHLLGAQGYRTALFHSGRFIYLGMQSMIQNRGFEVTEDAGAIGGNVHSSFGVDEPATISRILAWIDGVPRDQPFLIMYLPIAGHHPYETPEPRPFPEREEIDRYRNALFFGDAALGRFCDELEKRGLYEKTLFVVFGDHGEAFGEHEGNYGHTMFLYEENVRVPYLVMIPGVLEKQVRVARVASVIDTAPTILELLGLAIPAGYQGDSLLDGADRMALLFADYSIPFVGLRDGRWKFIDEVGADRPKLFQLDQDPQERENVASAFPARVQAYGERLGEWSRAQKELIVRGQ
ncbi:MAG: sulfatase-like hydrolase/transferase [Verrucomicrobiota bacterium]|nr:sulfatase-like hydrolase/transferase [Verrucomicrobiota bacterium]